MVHGGGSHLSSPAPTPTILAVALWDVFSLIYHTVNITHRLAYLAWLGSSAAATQILKNICNPRGYTYMCTLYIVSQFPGLLTANTPFL
jgi:hypothetical protein